ncbi:MAG: hypothetical protein WBA10_01785, partial [Elainellaceae cyanobacterium]
NYGKRLTRAEVFSALHGGSRGDDNTRTLADIVLHIDATYLFGAIDEDTVLRTILARRGHNVGRDIRKEFDLDRDSREFPNETSAQAYKTGEQALAQAVKFLQNEAGVPHFSFLAYRHLLVVLTRFFAHHSEPNPRNIGLLRRWFWRATIVGPAVFGGGTQASRVLCSQITPSDEVESVQSLLKVVSDYPLKLPNIHSFKSTAASTRILLCAMWSRHPRSFSTGKPYLQDELGRALEGRRTPSDAVYTIFQKGPSGGGALAANRFLFMGEDTVEFARDIFQRRLKEMPDLSWLELLASHVIDGDTVDALLEEDDSHFLQLREARLNDLVSEFLRSKAETSFEDTPPLSSLIIDEEDEED